MEDHHPTAARNVCSFCQQKLTITTENHSSRRSDAIYLGVRKEDLGPVELVRYLERRVAELTELVLALVDNTDKQEVTAIVSAPDIEVFTQKDSCTNIDFSTEENSDDSSLDDCVRGDISVQTQVSTAKDVSQLDATLGGIFAEKEVSTEDVLDIQDNDALEHVWVHVTIPAGDDISIAEDEGYCYQDYVPKDNYEKWKNISLPHNGTPEMDRSPPEDIFSLKKFLAEQHGSISSEDIQKSKKPSVWRRIKKFVTFAHRRQYKSGKIKKCEPIEVTSDTEKADPETASQDSLVLQSRSKKKRRMICG